MKTRLTLAVVIVTLVAFGSNAALAALAGDKVRWIAEETQTVVVLANGTRPDPNSNLGPPQPGDEEFITEDVFETMDGKTKGEKIGTDAIHCLFGVNHLHCTATVFLNGDQLHVATTFPMTEQEEEQNSGFDVAFKGGTGRFRDAGGDAHLTDIPSEDQQSRLTLWEVRLLQLSNETGGFLGGLLGGS